ncbi:sodium:solute symporter family protein [Methanospirillum hungatei]|jgi:SSS family transporter|uniref:sodium:solute symporter family protein n=1 Tax=Methanospirillum hungatei TaxID=2203 RepID=UPI0026EBB51C|nr:sodium:solute symporter family protein [Methanospirillum hungatei]MCA1916418.1 sodium:solute symporter family protein [Methanospirillum hungatei]
MADGATIGIVVIYCLAMIGIGGWASRKIKNTEDYLVAGRSLGFWVFVLLMIGTVCSGMSLLGVSGLGFKFGWPTIWEQIFVPLSIAFCIIFFGVKLHAITRNTGYMTVQDYLAHRYESPTALRTLSAVAGIIVSLIYLVGQYTAIAIVLMWLFEIPLWLALIIATLVVTIYTTIGGLYAVAWAALIQSFILILGVVIMAPIIIFYAGGFTHVNEFMASVNPDLVQPWMAEGMVFTPAYLVSFGVLLIIGLACAPHVINNILAVKDARLFTWAPLLGFLIYGIVMFLLKFAGFAGIVLVQEGVFTLPDVPNAQDFVILYGIQNAIPHIALWSIFAVIVLAAVMSTTDRLMLTIGAMFSWDIYKKIIRPDAPDTQVLLISKIVVILSALVTMIIALNPPEMLAFLIWMGIGVMLSTFAVPLLAGLYWRRATRMGAIVSMAAGLVSAGIFGAYYQYVAKLPLHFSFYAVIISCIAMIIVSLCTKQTSEKVLDETKTGWYIRCP